MLRELLLQVTEIAAPLIDLSALIIIVIGTAQALIGSFRVALSNPKNEQAARAVWMQFARWLVAGLTFQLAADIIETSVAPSWDDVGKLGAIAVIRTFLNFFLERDQHEVRELQHKPRQTD